MPQNELTDLFKRPSSEDCAESLYVLLTQVKTELVKIQLLQPDLWQQFYSQGYLSRLEGDLNGILHNDLPRFMRKQS